MSTFKKEHVQDMYPLSPMQEGMLFHTLTDQDSNTYLVQMVVPMRGALDIELLVESFRLLNERCDVFRTTFLYEKLKKPLQVVLSERPIQIHVEQFLHYSKEVKNQFVQEYLKKDRKRGFHLTKDPLVRLSILQTEENEWITIFSFHHIIMDGWCSDLVFNELCNLYVSLKNKEIHSLTSHRPFSQYIKWLEKQDKEAANEYWKGYLDKFEVLTSIPYITKENDKQEYKLQEYNFKLNESITNTLKKIARSHQVTLNVVFQTIWGIILQKYNNCHDVIFGTVVAGRPTEISDVDKMIGLFINSIPVRVSKKHNQSFYDLMIQLKEQALQTQKYDHLPLSDIQKHSIGKSLFDHILVFDNNPVNKNWKEVMAHQGVEIDEIRVIEHTNYNLNLTISQGNEVNIKFIYNANTFSEELVQQIAGHIQKVVIDVCDNPSILLQDISLITLTEKHHFLSEINNTKTDYSANQTIADLFEKQVYEKPNNTALVFNKEKVSYKQLNERSNQLAHFLQKKGVQPDDLIGLMVDRSFEMIIGMLGILKSNAAYLPMDSENPTDRLTMILEDSRTSIILVQRSYVEKLKDILEQVNGKGFIEYFVIEDLFEEMQEESIANPNRICNAENLAYVMYTSGSTGKPKGILTQHKNVTRVVKNTNYIDITEKDTLLQLSNYAFDGSTFDIFGALLNGARLVLITKEAILNMDNLLQIIEEEITIFFVTTALFNTLVDVNIESFFNVRKILFGGERASVTHVKKALKYMGKEKIIHVYGPTESTVFSTYYNVNEVKDILDTVPIGAPLANTDIYILSNENHLQPVGVIGELCIAGDGLARGYLNNPKLTEEKFVKNPFIPKERLYKTGDLARWLPNGSIEFMGRIDHQVKLRGFRIELGEIEYEILQHNSIQEAIVITMEDSNGVKKICSYFVAEREVLSDELRDYLSKRLPDYMIPSFFAQMKSLPLNANGKVDRDLLPIPDWQNICRENYVSPRNELERLLVGIWQEVLGIQKIGIFDNYFRLGGDSIKAIQISARLREKELIMNVKDLFKNPTIADFSSCITSTSKDVEEKYIGGIPLTPVQETFYQNYYKKKSSLGKMFLLYKKNGFQEKVVQDTWEELVNHHEMLRAYFKITDGKINQFINDVYLDLFEFQVTNYKAQGDIFEFLELKSRDMQKQINLVSGPLIKLEIIRTINGDYLLGCICNLLIDDESIQIICKDFSMIYNQLSQDRKVELPQKTSSFHTWVEALNNLSNEKVHDDELNYWKSIDSKKGDLRLENQLNHSSMPGYKHLTQKLSKKKTEQLLNRANQSYNTDVNDLLLAALGLAVSQWNRNSHLIINIEKSEREIPLKKVNLLQTVGNYMVNYPVRLNIQRESELASHIKRVKEDLKSIPKPVLSYGIRKDVRKYTNNINIPYNLSIDLTFRYLNVKNFFADKLCSEINDLSHLLNLCVECDIADGILLKGIIVNEVLYLKFIYNTQRFSQETVQSLSDMYMQNLDKVTKHCINKDSVELTPTDLGYSGISIDDLKELEAEIQFNINE
ncbi:amino acid adenylation domain-containing protein [Bacillus toyonensis]|uniref:non-ribosomal peptide synthetase n=1 Tax=Bacillus toyonensis TaxID=155322 RepID=UPI001F0F9611|nr:non-ribosomal peptide synthetase [Bacillus toyonensis]MCH5454749.1 amino acid adenylation domain-containing protein [Bacillus toyonensis]HDR7471131.1 amino acid adenylation domain-containing protein [Bacillus toyonensis]